MKAIKSDDWKAMVERIHAHLGIAPDYAASRGLTIFPEADELRLVLIDTFGKPLRLEPRAAEAWEKLEAAASKDGVQLLPFSGFRSYKYQLDLIKRLKENGSAVDDILLKLAAPGFSEHHTGRAVDITAPECPPATEEFENTQEFVWLTKYAGDFHFVMSYPANNPQGFIYEPWHWAFHG